MIIDRIQSMAFLVTTDTRIFGMSVILIPLLISVFVARDDGFLGCRRLLHFGLGLGVLDFSGQTSEIDLGNPVSHGYGQHVRV